MNAFSRSLFVSATAAVALSLSLTPAFAGEHSQPLDDLMGIHGKTKNIIVMVPDGMGLADVTAPRIRGKGISGAPPL